MAGQTAELLIPDASFRKQVEQVSTEKLSACFQCQKCTNGCPLTFAMDIPPHQIIHRVHLGLKEQILNSDTIWVCSSCETCTTRCPNDIDIAHIMDTLRQMSVKKGVKASQKMVPLFHSEFLGNIARFGRMHEITMMALFALKNEGIKGIFKQAGIGIKMLLKGKIKLLPNLSTGNKLKNIFNSKTA